MCKPLVVFFVFSWISCILNAELSSTNTRNKQNYTPQIPRANSYKYVKNNTQANSDGTISNSFTSKIQDSSTTNVTQTTFSGTIKTTKKRLWIFSPKYAYGLYDGKKLIAYLDYSKSRSEIKDFLNKNVIITGEMKQKQYWGNVVINVSSITGNMQQL